jgi:hypothetical protein
MNPKFIVEQKITPFVNKYSVYKADQNGVKGDIMSFAQQKRLAFKEKVEFYSDETKTELVFNFRAEKVLDVHGRYVIGDKSGQPVGSFNKIFGKSLFISSWNINDQTGQPVLLVKENSLLLALLRRLIGLVPYIGEYLSLIVMLFKYHFEFIDVQTGEKVGTYFKTTLFRDHYVLSLTDQASSTIDWRTYAAMAVALDALQSR